MTPTIEPLLLYRCPVAESIIRIARIKSHRARVLAQDEAIQLHETALIEKEIQLTSILRLKDAEITALQ